MRTLIAILPLVFLSACCTTPPKAPNAAAARLVILMTDRLEVSRDVAWTKFNNRQPVRDPQRETQLLNALGAKAAAAQVSAKRADTFFRAQIAASCRLQEELIAGWRHGSPRPATAPLDLKKDIRPRLDRISAAMIKDLAALPPSSRELAHYAQFTLMMRGYSKAVAKIAAGGLD